MRNMGIGWAGRIYCLVFCMLLLCVSNTKAQGTADIVGTVTDASGGVLPNATVTVKNLGTNAARSMMSTSSGDFSFASLPVGTYSVTVQAPGFKMFSAASVAISVGDHARVDAQMQVGDVTQTVEVQATVAAALQTDTSDTGGLVTPQAVEDLPVNGRNFMNLVTLAPGTNSGPATSQQSGGRVDDRRQSSAISANGQNLSSNNYLLDGMDNNERNIATIIVKPSIDAIQEVNVVTSMYGAQYGRAGGAVINLVTKSGANNFHGTAYEFFRNDMFDAKSRYNTPQAGNPLAGLKPEFRQNQYGGSLGGPIRKDKTFFFLDYEGLRVIQGTTSQPSGSGIIPTACELGRATCNGITQLGNFSDLVGVTIYNPFTHVAFPNNVVPLGSINPVSANYASTLPTLSAAACNNTTVCTFRASFNRIQYAHTADARVDHRFGSADTLFGRYSVNDVFTHSPGALPSAVFNGVTVFPEGTNGAPGTTSFPGPDNERQQAAAISEVHIFRPNLLMQISFQASRFAELSNSDNTGKNVNNLMGGPANGNTSVLGTNGWIPFAFSGQYSQIGDAFAVPTGYYDTNFQLAAALTWTKGAHTIKFGASILDRHWSINSVLQPGNFTFATTQTNSTSGLPNGSGGNAFASMLLGLPASINRNIPLIAPQYRANEYATYVQDDWRATRRLTLNLGVRWDLFMPFVEKHNQLSNFDPSNPVILQTLNTQPAGQNNVSRRLNYSPQLHDFQPRIGFAYTLGHGAVLRGGFGTSYYPQTTSSPSLLKNQPFQYTYAPSTVAGNPSLTLNSLPPIVPQSTCLSVACGLLLPVGQTSVSVAAGTVTSGSSYGGFKWATTYMYNLQLQKEFGANVITVGYVGENGRHLGQVIPNSNLALPPNGPGVAPLCVGVLQTRNPNSCQPYFSTLPLLSSSQLLSTAGLSNYNSLQLQFLRRYRSGLTVSANYAYSSILDNVGGSGGACGTCAQVLNNLSRDYANSDYDVRHRITVTSNYELPFGKGKTGLAGQIMKGWQVNGIYLWSGGLPFSVTDSENLQGNAATGYRVNLAPASPFTKGLGEWFDVNQFRQQPIGTAGNEPRNFLFSPSFTKVDFSLFKDFQIKESLKLQFRAEVFNIFNTPAFAAPANGMSAWVYGAGTTGNSIIGSTCAPSGFSTIGVTTGGVTASPTSTCVPSPANLFGQITATSVAYTPRDFQFALKLIF